MTNDRPLVRDFDESQLLATIFPLLPTNAYVQVGTGDDCAVITAPNNQFVVSTDILIENQHFKRNWSTGSDVGWRAAMQNLADIAAMGAVPTSVVLALGLPGDLEVAWVHDFYRGFIDACKTVGAAIVGGDLSASAVITVAVTVHGDMQSIPPVLRSGARPGDVVAHSGNLGWSAAGLALLSAGHAAPKAEHPTYPSGPSAAPSMDPVTRAISLFLRPQPVLTLGPVAARAGATALMDVSDGLLRDAGRIAAASNVGIDLALSTAYPKDREHLETVAETLGQEPQAQASLWRLSGGEDHGLLATFPNSDAVPHGFAVIGTVRAVVTGQPRITIDGKSAAGLSQGWDHFR